MMIRSLFFLLIGSLDKLPPLELPDIDYIGEAVGIGLQYFLAGVNAFVALIGQGACSILLGYLLFVFMLNGVYLSYQMIWWFIKKIPMIDVDQ